MLGSLPAIAEFCRRLDIAGIVDRACPIRDIALASHGQVIEALIANRLTAPRPLVRVAQWGAEFAVEEVFGIGADLLNDDRIGRALDAIAPALDGIVGSVGARAITTFGIDVSRLHWDMTSMSLFGDYAEPEAGFAEPSYGHPKDRRNDLKQIQAGLAVTGDGGIPVFHRAFDGRAAEISQVVGTMESLRDMCGPRKFMIVGDSKLVSYKNLRALADAEVSFIAPASKNYVPTAELAACDLEAATAVDYVAARDRPMPTKGRGTYRVLESEELWLMGGPRKVDRPLSLRKVYVWSSADAGAAVSSRNKKLARATEDLAGLVAGLGGRHYATPAAVQARLTVIATKRRVGDYLRSVVGTDPAGKPTLEWHFDQSAIDAEAASDGWYCLLTNLEAAKVDAGEVLTLYKGQEVVERRYGSFKGPLAVSPMFLKNNRRIQALISVICLALLIFCLVERELRRAIAPNLKMAGLGGYRDARPTGRLIFEALARLKLYPAQGNRPPVVPEPPPLQAEILARLGLDPTTQR
ncbi:MAG: IS1634 family transposase [Acidimicrobiales bacterium]